MRGVYMNITIDNGNLVLTLSKEEISGINISAGSNYNYASLYAKISDGEFFNCSCEWEGKKDIPEFVVAIMSMVKQNKDTASISGAWLGREAEYAECIIATKDKNGD